MMIRNISIISAAVALTLSMSAHGGDLSTCSMAELDLLSDYEPIARNVALFYGEEPYIDVDPPESPDIYLEATDGTQVQLVGEDIGWSGYCAYFLMKPLSALEANTEYEVLGEDAPSDVYFTVGSEIDTVTPHIEVTPSQENDFVVNLDLDDDVVLVTYKVPIDLGLDYIGLDANGLTEVDLSEGMSKIERGYEVTFTAYDVAGNSSTANYTVPEGAGGTGSSTDSDSGNCSASPASPAFGLLKLVQQLF